MPEVSQSGGMQYIRFNIISESISINEIVSLSRILSVEVSSEPIDIQSITAEDNAERSSKVHGFVAFKLCITFCVLYLYVSVVLIVPGRGNTYQSSG